MFRQITNLFGGRKGTVWHVLDCSGSAPSFLQAMEGDAIPIGGDADWVLECGEEKAILRSNAGPGNVCFNGIWVEKNDLHKLLTGGEYTVIIPSGLTGLPLIICGGEPVPAWALNGKSPSLLLRQQGNKWEGPFEKLSDMRARLVHGQVPEDSNFGIDGSQNAFLVRDLWPDVVEQAMIRPVEVSQRQEDYNTVIEGDLVCPFCRQDFNPGHCLYFSPPPAKQESPVLPASWDVAKGLPLDKHGKACVDRACPHCQQRLPKSFGKNPYTIFSLVGQSGSGKSYYLAALFHELPGILSRLKLGYLGDDAELNREFGAMSKIPFKPGPSKNRYIPKTDNVAATQIPVSLRGESAVRYIPKPIIFRIGKGRANPKFITFYDNPGEHFTTVEAGGAVTEAARIAASHLAFASAVFLLYDPTLSAGFQNKLGMQSAEGEQDQQSTMLDALPDRIYEVREKRQKEIEEKLGKKEANKLKKEVDVPLAVLVGKWDLWDSMGPELSRDYLTPEKELDLNVVKANSDQLASLLDTYSTGVPAAANLISGEVVFFPVSSYGEVGSEEIFIKEGVKGAAPAEPVRPWSVEIPFLWALWRTHRDLVPVVGEEQ